MVDSSDIIFIVAGILVSGIIGGLIGALGKQANLGFLLGLLLGPLGWLITLIAAIAKSKERQRELEQFMTAKHAMAQQAAAATAAAATERTAGGNVRVRRDGAVIGSWPLDQIRDYLEQGNLTWNDEYYSTPDRAWVELAGHPDL